MRIEEVSGIFLGWLGGGLAFGQLRNHVMFVPPAVIPGAGEGDLAISRLPEERFVTAMDEREDGSGDDWNVGAPNEFEQPQSVRDFFVAPLVAGNDGDAQDFYLRGLDQGQQGLQIAAAGAGTILIDDDFAAGLGEGCGGGNQEKEK